MYNYWWSISCACSEYSFLVFMHACCHFAVSDLKSWNIQVSRSHEFLYICTDLFCILYLTVFSIARCLLPYLSVLKIQVHVWSKCMCSVEFKCIIWQGFKQKLSKCSPLGGLEPVGNRCNRLLLFSDWTLTNR